MEDRLQRLAVVQRPVIMAIHSDPNLLVLWFTIGPSNKEHKWSGIKDVHEGEDIVLIDSSSLQRSGGHGSPPVVKDLPGGKSLGARFIICNILWEVATSFLRGCPLQQAIPCCTVQPCSGLLFLPVSSGSPDVTIV